jgi:hypothetical protein
MFENHVMQMYDTREMEMRARLSQRRVDLVPPFRGSWKGVLGRLADLLRSAKGRPQTHTTRSTVPSTPCL